jgi:type IV pilus assembly protein PilB
MFENHNTEVFEILHGHPAIATEALVAIKNESRAAARSVAELVVSHGFLTRSELLRMVAHAIGAEYVPDPPATLSPEVVTQLPANLARNYAVIPFRADAHSLDVLAADPLNPRLSEELAFAVGRRIRLAVSDPAAIQALIVQHCGRQPAPAEAGPDQLKENLDVPGETGSAPDEKLSTNDLEALASQAPVVRFVNLVLGQAIRDKASDVHFEPFEKEFKIRYRIDGVLYEMSPPSHTLALSITSRLKVLANLNIAERRLPQDGRIRLTFEGKAIDLRVSTLPTQFGESVVLRVLDQSAVGLELTQLGMPDEILRGVEKTVRRPNGIFIVTGPTGSGKTTTLYSALRAISTPDLKVLTAEDPVEYEIDGIMQTPVLPAVGLTFAAALRSFLRQDPDVIMVGEIRDLETAQIAIQASLTGHLVLSTLHTNDAAGAVTRLVDMGVEPYLIASTVEAVLAQRLVRRVCPDCRRSYEPDEKQIEELALDAEKLRGRQFYCGAGCNRCSGTGYRGRTGIYEWLPMSETVRAGILENSSSLVLRQRAITEGMTPLREAGWRALLEGVTTFEEVLRCT